MRIGELSKITGISQRMLRFYETEKLITPARSKAGYREYSKEDIKLIKNIKILNESGIKLKTIKELLPCIESEHSIPRFYGCPAVKASLQIELEKLDEKIVQLTQSRNALAQYVGDLLPDRD
ncbi:MerR family transcriptional regulator [Microbulbifer sp. SSSA007]|uniref:MerR family transcriptional regulator n=1 Tax=Microbulbifer sp. SSSA007 TaxID=3243379 RepID=UPI004039FB56